MGDEAVESEIDEELEEILKGDGEDRDDDDDEDDDDRWGDDDNDDGEDEKDGDDEDDELDEENVEFSGSEDEFQPTVKDKDKSHKDLKRKADVKKDGKAAAVKKAKKSTAKIVDEDEDDNDNDMDEFDFIEKASAKAQKGSKKTKKGSKLADLFADAEEFSHLLEGNAVGGAGKGKGGRGFDMLGMGAVSNKDKASVKQLEWESGRDKWVRGEDWRKKGKPGRMDDKKKMKKKK